MLERVLVERAPPAMARAEGAPMLERVVAHGAPNF